MSAVKDPAIKLFGKTIQLPTNEAVSAAAHDDTSSANTTSSQDNNKEPSGGELTETKQEDASSHPIVEELIGPPTSSGISEDPKTPNDESENSSKNNKEDPSETSISEEKTLKKPDKILPCPRCNSMDTKFCYYNNYNVNQPRHFCKNCQRYWTAGGTMRNVPVGSGRRKNKSCSASQYRQIMVSEALQAAQGDAAINSIHHHALNTNGTVLTFGSDAPLCASMASALNLEEKSKSCDPNGLHGHEQRISASTGRRESGESQLSGCTTSNLTEKRGNGGLQELVLKNFQGYPSHPQLPCFPGTPWPYPWNPAQWRSPMHPPPAFGPSNFPIPFYPAPPYWGCPVPGPWNMPWLSPASPSPDMNSGPYSPTLGKHSRDGRMVKTSSSEQEELIEEKDLEGCVLTPKTLRINDPSESAKSSIWSTLGFKNENSCSTNPGGLFQAFRPKGDEKNHVAETSLVLQANPAALSRSLNFQETT
ncbi:hypothetical protein RJ640_007884 [Escallonia rubra]|uniref:Dof-type domain-containing protein n=1 Tax=Escallonia rubra TaxID=112253 RepID=A0AA88QEL1_9ASTE|nr:hypothetical protein RJ640_007884 [Escallonia rubra]